MDEREQEKIYSDQIKAGKRTYFFDVKATRANDYFLTITESRWHPQGGGFTCEKHKLFLYKEDFDTFTEALRQTVDPAKTELLPDVDFTQFTKRNREETDDYASRTPKRE
ncbi:MAG: DUF3276 family protein [Spirosoma sp.]|nr:DUF3276 family protein [Spirosoma sp.]